jgi:hypothetical protein
MTDPREASERHDAGRSTPETGGRDRADGAQRNDADGMQADADRLPPAEGDDLGPDANVLDADNAVEEDSVESVEPGNQPA